MFRTEKAIFGIVPSIAFFELLIDKFKEQNREFYYNKNIPLNDGGISVGQIYHLI